jgi:hypothetical protein
MAPPRKLALSTGPSHFPGMVSLAGSSAIFSGRGAPCTRPVSPVDYAALALYDTYQVFV